MGAVPCGAMHAGKEQRAGEGVLEWRPRQGGGWEELGHQSDTAFGGSGDTLSPLLGTWQHWDFGPGSAMCRQQRARLQVVGSRSSPAERPLQMT